MLAWLYGAAHGGGALGIAERVDTAIENSWPLVIVTAIWRSAARDMKTVVTSVGKTWLAQP
ncbi:MAG: hypothetical protein M3N95_09465 [Actinomycetota bacterium]|nr:hypothetical protein [Actinomycetota bacterium]